MELPVTRERGGSVPARWTRRLAKPAWDYVDLHRLDLPGVDRFTAEAWARAMFEDDRPVLVRLRRRGLLGATLSRPRGFERVGSWDVAQNDPQLVRLRGRGPGTADEVLVVVEPEGVTLLTAVTYRHEVAGHVWAVLSVLHRRFAPLVLRHAARDLVTGGGLGPARAG